MVIKDVKCLEYSKNNKKYVNVFWDFLDCVRDNTCGKLDIILDDLEVIQAYIY